jgi:hypothetical protein
MDVSAITSTLMAMSQSNTQEMVNESMLKMNAEAEQAMADMLMQNARQIQALSHSSNGGIIDLFA